MRNPFRTAADPPVEVMPTSVRDDASEKATKTPQDVDVSVAATDLDHIAQAHQYDPNLPQEKLEAVKKALRDGDAEEILEADALFTDDSPYAEVRAAVRNTDGGEVANTVRAWILGMIFVTIGSGINMFLSMRSPAISFPSVVVQLLVYPIGCFWAKVMPTRVFNTFGTRWTLNTGPFTIKEHVVITLMANVSIGYAYSTDALLALQGKPFYNINLGWGFAILFTLSSQLIGISFAGMFRRFLIWPSAMMWPSIFSNTALFYALHDKSKQEPSTSNGWRISRYRYFFYVLCGMFCYYWIPGVLWQGLSVFAFITWIRPNNVVLNQIFGGFTGLSLIPITFDWTYVNAYLGDPLLAPVHTHINTLLGLFIFVIITSIGIVYSGSIYADYLPMVTSQTYDNTQSAYNVSRILNSDHTFNLEKYTNYSPLFLPPTFALNYGLSFAALTAVLVHTGLFHGKEIWYRFRAARNQEPDVHLEMMKKYPEAPDWWYVVLFVATTAMGLATCLAYDSQLPWWTYFVSIILALVFVIPTCSVLAISNIALALNVLSPFLAGFMIPGKPIGVMMFKVYSTIVLGQAQTYSSDLKMAHYVCAHFDTNSPAANEHDQMKIPPKTTFWCQVVATVWAVFVQIATMNWTLGNIPDCCTTTQPSKFSCPNGKAFFSSSIVWGVIGPQRMFGTGSIYAQFNWFWLIGACLPIIIWVAIQKFHLGFARHLNAPIMLGAMAWLPPATPLSFSSWGIFGLLFNHFIKNKYRGWWHNYNFVTAAGLDAGLIISTIVIFFAITLPGITIPQWWGNVDVFNTKDASYNAWVKTVPDGATFGPATW